MFKKLAIGLLLLAGCSSPLDHGKCVSKKFTPAWDEPKEAQKWIHTGSHASYQWTYDIMEGDFHWHWVNVEEGHYEPYTYYVHHNDLYEITLFGARDGEQKKETNTLAIEKKDFDRATEGEWFFLHPVETE